MHLRVSRQRSGLLVSAMLLLVVLGTPAASSQAQNVIINEVMFFPDTADTVHERNHEWVELYNSGSAAFVGGWVISNRDGSQDAVLPSWNFPSSTYLVIHFTTGTDDNDFSDGAGHYYAGTADVFSENMDECALYAGTPSGSTIIDFMNWSEGFSYSPGQAHDHAVSAGKWISGDHFTPVDTSDIYRKIAWVIPGESVGRDSSSVDSDTSGDWAVFGGTDAIYATPGTVNYQLLQFGSKESKALEPRDPVTWTVIYYMSADNDLQDFAFRALNEFEKYGATHPNVNVVVQADFQNLAGMAGTYRIFVQEDLDGLVVNSPCSTIAEQNSGSGQALGDFIYWAQQKYPAAKYVLWIDNHGAGWKGVSVDWTSGRDYICMQELKAALDHTIPPKLDVVVFDACLMAMAEVADQIKQRTEMMVASEEVINTFDYPYNSIFAAMDSNLTWSSEQLAVDIVSKFKANVHGRHDYTISATDCRNLGPLITQIDNFGGELEWGLDDYDFHYQNHYIIADNVQIHVQDQVKVTQHFEDANFIDLYHFAQLIDADGGIPPDYKTQVQPIVNSLQKGGSIIKAEEHDGYPNAHGLSVYFPSAQTKAAPPVPKNNVPHGERPFDDPWPSRKPDNSALAKYASDPDDCKPPDDPCVNNYTQARNHPYEPTPGFLFVEDTDWDEFLHRYYEPVADAGKDTAVEVGTSALLDGVGSSDSDTRPDGTAERYFWDFNSLADAPPDCPPSADEDWDRDCTDDANDDKDGGTTMQVNFPCSAPGTYYITLTVWDDHNLQPGHGQHYETDQDEVIVRCIDTVFTFEPPGDRSEHENGTFQSDHFVASDGTGNDVISVVAAFTGTGIGSISVIYTIPPPSPYVEGYVEYEVADHCQEGGIVSMTATNDAEETLTGEFAIALTNIASLVVCPHDGVVDYSQGYSGYAVATDDDGDPLSFFKMDGPENLQVTTDGIIIWETGPGDVGGPYDVTIGVADVCEATATCTFALTVTAPVGCCQHSDYCAMMTDLECMEIPGTVWYPAPYRCVEEMSCQAPCGDCTLDGIINLSDAITGLNYLFKGSQPPEHVCLLDVTCNHLVDIGDIVYLLNYLFKGGPLPCPDCCAGTGKVQASPGRRTPFSPVKDEIR